MEKGNMGLGVLIGFILIVLIGWIPILGALIAGGIAGAIARGPLRGLVAGFVAGIVGAVVLAIFLTTVGAFLAGIIGALIGLSIGTVLIIISAGGAIVAGLGGLIGGAIRQ